MTYYYYFKINLFIKGRELFDPSKRDFPLHKAVFENNLPMISRLINCAHDGIFYVNKNEIDCCGNTPLTLAVKLGYIDAVKVLSDLFTCPKLKPFQNCNII
jgi:ankyrin repeat protein